MQEQKRLNPRCLIQKAKYPNNKSSQKKLQRKQAIEILSGELWKTFQDLKNMEFRLKKLPNVQHDQWL